MSILVFYNLNHHYFRCDYAEKIATYSYQKGKIDHFNRLYIQNITSNSHTYSVLHLPKISFKKTLGYKMVAFGNKLSGTSPVEPNKHKYPWWLKK